MTRIVKAPLPAGRFLTATFAAAVAVSGVSVSAQADDNLPASALIVRNTVVAMAMADAALPVATATAMVRDVPPAMPASFATLKPETASALASMRAAAPPRRTSVAVDTSYFDRRYRPYRDPFLLMLGVAY